MAKQWTRRRPFAKLIFHTKERRPFAIGGGDAARDINATANIVAINTTNSIHDIAGTFNLDLIYRRDKRGQPIYYEAVQPLDVVDIWLDHSGTTMVGIVDRVSKMTTMTGAGPRRRVKINGRSLAAIWLFDLIRYFKDAVKLPRGLQERNLDLRLGSIKLDFYGQSAAFAIKTLYEKLPALEIKLKDASLKDFITVDDELYTRTGEVVFNIGLTGYNGSMYEYFKKYAGQPFNEIFADSKEGKLYLRLRPTPFSMGNDQEQVQTANGYVHPTYSWETIQTWITDKSYHEVSPSMVREENLRRSHGRAYSIFAVLPTDPLVPNPFVTFPPLIEKDLYKEIGSRDYVKTIDFLPLEKHKPTQGTIEKFIFYRNKLYLWNRDNHRFEEGVITIRGDANIRAGDKIMRTDNEKTYYVESVSNRWQFGRPMVTTLNVTRGATEKQRKEWYDAGLDYLRSIGEA